MAKSHSPRYTVAALLLLGAVATVMVSLGQWQLRRSDERRAILASIEAGRKLTPLVLDTQTPPEAMRSWRMAQTQGVWLPALSVLLDNRNHEGKPGYWLATPLLLDANTREAVLVLRGWMPRVIPDQQGRVQLNLPLPGPGMQTIRGELSPHVPRLFELWSLGTRVQSELPKTLPRPDGVVPQVQNLPLDAYAAATNLKLLPTVLSELDDAQPKDGLIRDWPQPSVNFQQNTFYAVQWFLFALFAAIAWLVVLIGAIRRMRQRAQGV